MKKKCTFCNFNDKEVLVYEDKLCYAIISKKPINKHHVLVIPRNHYEDFIDLPDKTASHIFLVAKKISKAVRKTCKPDAIEHISDDDIGKIGINLVSHYKFHIIPRFKNDKVIINWNRDPDPGIKTRSKFAKDIRSKL